MLCSEDPSRNVIQNLREKMQIEFGKTVMWEPGITLVFLVEADITVVL